MTACVSPTCPRRESCGRHDAEAERGTDYSYGPWFDPEHCFWWRPVAREEPSRVGSLLAGRWP